MRLFATMLGLFIMCEAALAEFTLDSGYPSGGTWKGLYGGVGNAGAKRTASATGNPWSTSGPIAYHWTWKGPSSPPSFVLLRVEGNASWGGVGGKCTDGLGDPEVLNLPHGGPAVGGTSQGTHYVTRPVGSGIVTYSIDPSASASTGGGGFNVTATVMPFAIKLTGPTKVEENYLVAVGQRVKAEVVSDMACAGDLYVWQDPGANAFTNYQVSSQSGAFTALSLPNPGSPSMECYFGAKGTANIRCLYYSWVMDDFYELSAQVGVDGPERSEVTTSCGTMKLLILANQTVTVYSSGGPSPTDFRTWGAKDKFGKTWGCYKYDMLKDPGFLVPGTGVWTYAQLLGGKGSINGTITTFSGIDGGFPYPNCVNYAADGQEMGLFADRPGAQWGILSPSDLPFSFDDDEKFHLYIFYRPVASAAGPSVYVPVLCLEWSATGTCGTPDNVIWSQQDRGSGFSRTTSYPWPFPTWP